MNISEMSDGMKADLLYVAAHEPVRLSALDDGGAAMVVAGLLDAGDPGDVFGVLTLDGCDAVDELRRAS